MKTFQAKVERINGIEAEVLVPNWHADLDDIADIIKRIANK